jgi:hypothetical protein
MKRFVLIAVILALGAGNAAWAKDVSADSRKESPDIDEPNAEGKSAGGCSIGSECGDSAPPGPPRRLDAAPPEEPAVESTSSRKPARGLFAEPVLATGLQGLFAGPDPAHVDGEAPAPRRWGRDIASPYYPLHGVQSPLRGDGIHIGGDFWIDGGYEKSRRGLETEADLQYWIARGRFMLDVTATKTWGRFFVQAKGQMLASIEQIPGVPTINVDDAWVRFGMWDLFDIQVGRFEAWEVYHKGEGLERDTLEDLGAFGGPDIYEVNYAFYRQNGFGMAAMHAYPLKWLRFELNGVFGNALGYNSWGVRPAGILDFGWIKLKVAGEYRKRTHQEDGKKEWEVQRGVGGGLHFYFDNPNQVVRFQFGANAAYGVVDRVDSFDKVDEKGSPDTLSVGTFFNFGFWSAVLGLGYNHTLQGDRQFNDQIDRSGNFVHQQMFVSFRHPIVIDNLMAKVVFSYARADLNPAYDNDRLNDMFSVRLRLHMVF